MEIARTSGSTSAVNAPGRRPWRSTETAWSSPELLRQVSPALKLKSNGILCQPERIAPSPPPDRSPWMKVARWSLWSG